MCTICENALRVIEDQAMISLYDPRHLFMPDDNNKSKKCLVYFCIRVTVIVIVVYHN